MRVVQELTENDSGRRVEFCDIITEMIAANRNSLRHIYFSAHSFSEVVDILVTEELPCFLKK